MQPLLRIKDAAERLGISQSALNRLIRTGAIPAYRVTPRSIALRPEDLLAYVESVRVPIIKLPSLQDGKTRVAAHFARNKYHSGNFLATINEIWPPKKKRRPTK